MLRKIPFNSNLISIGNSPHYNGQLVYSDGRVAYGWQYNVQQPTVGINRATAGLWIGAERIPDYGDDYYVLMNENLQFDSVAIRGIDPFNNYYSYYCYPWVCNTWFDTTYYVTAGEMILDNEHHYEFLGEIVRMDNNGNILTYYSDFDSEPQHYWLCSYANDGSVTKTDLKPISDTYNGLRDWYRISAGEGYEHISTTTLTSLNCDGAYVTVETEDPDEPFIHFYCANGTCVESPFPTHITLSANATLSLPSLNLVVDGTIYNNDPLKILDAKYTTFLTTNVNGVHAYKNIIISQFSDTTYENGYLFKNGTLYDRNAFRDSDNVIIHPVCCWSLSEIPGGQWYAGYNY